MVKAEKKKVRSLRGFLTAWSGTWLAYVQGALFATTPLFHRDVEARTTPLLCVCVRSEVFIVALMMVTLRTGLYLLITGQEPAGVELVGLDLQCALDGAR